MQRNSWIVTIAAGQIGTSGGQCKVWVRDVVQLVSGVQIPPNADIPVPWYWQMPWFGMQYGYVTGWLPYQNPRIAAGCIIQMQVPNRSRVLGPHTAIVSGFSAVGMYFIDSNWKGDGIVSCHHVAGSDFARWTQNSNYTVYTIQ